MNSGWATSTANSHQPEFNAQKSWELNNTYKLRSIVRDHERCIRHARSRWELNRCHQSFNQAIDTMTRKRQWAIRRGAYRLFHHQAQDQRNQWRY